MARGRWKLKRDLAAEQGQIQSAAKKRGLWGSIGGTLLGGLAMAVTGGAASPVVAGLMAGGGKYIGGHLGNLLAGKTSGGKLKGGKFFQGEREALAGQIKENIGAQAAKAGLTAGMAKLPGAALKFGKGGFSATVQKASGKAGELEKAESLYTAEEGGLGKLLDFRGSFVGKGLGKMQAARATRETADAAREWEAIQEGMAPTYGDIDIDKVLQQGEAQRVAKFGSPAAKLKSAQIDEMLAARDPLPRVFEPSMDEMMERKINIKGPGFQKSDQVFPDPTGRSSVQQAAFRSAKAGPQITESTIRQGARGSGSQSYLSKVGKVSSKYEGAIEAQAKAIAEGEVPSWYGAPKGTTWGETALDPGMSDLSFAGSYATSPDQVPYTGDVPDLMDMYRDELAGSGSGGGMLVEQGSRDYWESGGDMPLDIDQPGLISADMTQFPEKQTLLQQTKGPGSFLPEGQGAHMKAIEDKIIDSEMGADVSIDEGFTGPLEESVPFDRSSMLNRQASARYQASANIFKQNFPEFSGSGSPMGAGTDETRTGLWESVGTSFPVQSPDIVGGFGSLPEYDVQEQNMINPSGSKFRTDLQKSSAWHKRLFGRRGY